MEAAHNFDSLVGSARKYGPIRLAVIDPAQRLVIETVRDAQKLGLATPCLIGDPEAIARAAKDAEWRLGDTPVVPAKDDPKAAEQAAAMVRAGEADAVMKGNIHTDTLMRALLDKERGLRLAGERVSHVFVAKIPAYHKLLGITDAAINIAPDLNAKAEIVRNAVELFRLLGVGLPKVAVLSAVETVNPAIASTLDAACLTLMARRGQIADAMIDGPLAFDNAISATAAKEKAITSQVAGDADIVLVPDLVSGNILAKNLEYFADAIAAGLVVGLAAPVVLNSRADPPASRLAAVALASLAHHRAPQMAPRKAAEPEFSMACLPQPEQACRPTLA